MGEGLDSVPKIYDRFEDAEQDPHDPCDCYRERRGGIGEPRRIAKDGFHG